MTTISRDQPLVDRDQLYADLSGARAVIAKGWGQNFFDQDDTRYCAAGAIMKTIWGSTWLISSEDHLWARYKLAGHALSGGIPILIAWNDAPERVQQDVLNLFDKTIANLDEIVTQLEGK